MMLFIVSLQVLEETWTVRIDEFIKFKGDCTLLSYITGLLLHTTVSLE